MQNHRRTWLVAVLLVASGAGCGQSPKEDGQGGDDLAAPASLTAAPLGGGVHLTWKDVAGEDEFSLERKPPGGDFAVLANTPFDTTQYHDADVLPGATYVYRVRARAGNRVSAYSKEATVKVTGAGEPEPAPEPGAKADAGAADKPADAGSSLSEDAGGNRDAGGNSAPDVGSSQADAQPPATGVSFRRDIVPVLLESCGSSTTGCHTREAYFAWSNMDCRGWLALEDVPLGARGYGGMVDGKATGCRDLSLYERLTQLDAWMCSPKKRYVRGGSLSGSQLYQVIAGDPTNGGACEKSPGKPMTAMPPAPLPTLDAATKKKFADWIMAGAPNN